MTLGRSGWITLAIAAAIIFYQIILPPAIGIADNGDFAKIIGKFDLKAPVDDSDDRSFPYIHLRYTLEPANHWDGGCHSSETLLVRTALRLNRILSKDGAFDIRCMGVIHALLFLLAFAFLLPLLRLTEGVLRIMLLALAVLIFCDVAYAAYYNSFYMDAGAFVFLSACNRTSRTCRFCARIVEIFSRYQGVSRNGCLKALRGAGFL